MLQSKANSTAKKYLGAIRRWKQWALSHNLKTFPVTSNHLALYLQHVGETAQSKSAVEESMQVESKSAVEQPSLSQSAVHAMAWLHDAAGIPSPTTNPFIAVVLDGLQKTLTKPVSKKAPFNMEILTAMSEETMRNQTLANVRLTSACLLAFAGFLRFNELHNLRPYDLTIDSEKLLIKIRKSKTDQLRKGDEVLISRTGTITCPMAMLERYLNLGGIKLTDSKLLYQGIVKTKSGEKLRSSGGFTYTRMRELLQEKLVQLGYSPDSFGIHSLRAGGATAAANAGIQDRIFKRHGRWKTDGAKDGYIEDSIEKRLEVSKQLGL